MRPNLPNTKTARLIGEHHPIGMGDGFGRGPILGGDPSGEKKIPHGSRGQLLRAGGLGMGSVLFGQEVDVYQLLLSKGPTKLLAFHVPLEALIAQQFQLLAS